MQTASITITSAPPGVGKTYCRGARFLVDEFLPEGQGVHWSNLPMQLDDWKDGDEHREGLLSMVGRLHGLAEDEIRERVRPIAREELAGWMADEECGPWSTFDGVDLDGSHIAIDEAHLYWPRAGRPDAARRMLEWLSEVRHRGATVELITQHETQLSEGLVKIANHRMVLVKADDQVDPVFGIPLFDWFQVWSRWTGAAYRSLVRQDLYVPEGRRQRLVGSKVWEINPDYYGVYKSHSAPLRGGKAGKGRKLPAERFGRLAILGWFFARHPWSILSRVAVLVACIWLMSGGGGAVVAAAQRHIQEAFSPKASAVKVEGSGGTRVEAGKAPVDKMAALIADNGALLQENHKLRVEVERVEALEGRIRDLEAKLGEYGAVVLVSNNEMTMANGDRYRVGETIEFGPYAGAVVAEIENRDRRVRLSDGRVLRLGLSGSARGFVGPGVPGSLPGVDGGGVGTAGDGGGNVGPTDHAQLPRDYAGGAVSVDRGGDGIEHRCSTGVGGSAGIVGDPGRALGGRDGRSSGSPGRELGSSGHALLPRPDAAGVPWRVGASGSASVSRRDTTGRGGPSDDGGEVGRVR